MSNSCIVYPDFNENQYYLNYTDLANAKICNSAFDAFTHWCKWGKNEQRTYKVTDKDGKEFIFLLIGMPYNTQKIIQKLLNGVAITLLSEWVKLIH
jgi:hypothetical protein